MCFSEYFSFHTKTAVYTEGEHVSIVFKVIDENVPVLWYKGNMWIKPSDRCNTSVDGKRHELKIYPSLCEDSGEYVLRANGRSKKTKLIIKCKSNIRK